MGNLLTIFQTKIKSLLHWEMLLYNWLLIKTYLNNIRFFKKTNLLYNKPIEKNIINCYNQRKNWVRLNINFKNIKIFNHQSILNQVLLLNSNKSNQILKLKFLRLPNCSQNFKNSNNLLRQKRNMFVNYKIKTRN